MFLLLLFNKSRYYNSCNNLTKQLNSKPVQIGSTCRQQNQFDSKIENCFQQVRKHCGKKKKCWIPAFSPFSHCFQKGSKNQGLFGKGISYKF